MEGLLAIPASVQFMNYTIIAQLLLLLVVANGAPIITQNIFGDRFTQPLDCGIIFFDGRPLLGPTKTIRGIIFAVFTTALIAPLLGIFFVTGALFGLCTMLGDLVSSFIKRRLNINSSDSALGLDQGLEALLPVLIFRSQFALQAIDIFAIVGAFFLLEIVLSPLLYRLHIRNRPL